jgi:hypothetical protein
MKKLSKLTLLVILGLGSLLYSACKKEMKDDPGKGKKTTRSFPVTPPTTEGGMLVFASYDDYEAFENYLIDQVNKSDGTKTSDEILQGIEDDLGFTSLRKIALGEFELLNAAGWKDTKDIPEEHWITSKTTRALLNRDREVKIEDKIQHYVNPDYIAAVHESHPEMLDALRVLPLTAPLEDILNIDGSRYYMAVIGIKTHEVFDIEPIGPLPLPRWRLNGSATQFNPCAASLTVYLSGLQLWDNFYWRANKGRYFIDWGDATPLFEISSSIGSDGTIVVPLSKTYSTAGLKTIKVYVQATSPVSSGASYAITKTFKVNILDIPRCHDFFKSHMQDYSLGATTKLRGYVQYYPWYNIWHHRDECKIMSYTECYVTDDGSNWHRFAANWVTLCSKVETTALDESCNPYTSPYLADYHCSSNTYTRYAERTSFRFHWQYVTARHEASFHGSAVGFDHVISSCE